MYVHTNVYFQPHFNFHRALSVWCFVQIVVNSNGPVLFLTRWLVSLDIANLYYSRHSRCVLPLSSGEGGFRTSQIYVNTYRQATCWFNSLQLLLPSEPSPITHAQLLLHPHPTDTVCDDTQICSPKTLLKIACPLVFPLGTVFILVPHSCVYYWQLCFIIVILHHNYCMTWHKCVVCVTHLILWPMHHHQLNLRLTRWVINSWSWGVPIVSHVGLKNRPEFHYSSGQSSDESCLYPGCVSYYYTLY